MVCSKKVMALAVPLALACLARQAGAETVTPTVMDEVVVKAGKVTRVRGAAQPDALSMAIQKNTTANTAALLGDLPGVSLQGAGGVSSLPVLRGLADDRVRIKVDGMDLVSACANHMNPPLSYLAPSSVASVEVSAGVTPVSVGGDSIAGTIAVTSAGPEFAGAGETLFKGEGGIFYRSNGHANGGHLSATAASDKFSLRYDGSVAESGNVSAGRDFKAAGYSAGTTSWLSGKEIGSTAYRSENHALNLAMRHEDDLLEMKLGVQRMPYQGFPNQAMDMTGNNGHQVNLRHVHQFAWGTLESRLYREHVQHTMNFLEDKLRTGSLGMPMATDGKTIGASVKADMTLSERDSLKLGLEYQYYRLNDWWDPVSPKPGMMGGGTFLNINNGRRDRVDVYGEWLARWNDAWKTRLGLRNSLVTMNAGNVQGYSVMAYGDPTNPATQPGAFNASNRKKHDNNIDVTAEVFYAAATTADYGLGYARKTRSPNLYERFAWSTNPMAMNMIGWFGDGNGYVGNAGLKPEVAHTVSLTADWHDAARESWQVKLAPYYTYVQDFIDAERCPVGSGSKCTVANQKADSGFVALRYVNQSARLYGMDLSGSVVLAKSADYGTFTARGVVNITRGSNETTHDSLYNIMPLNARVTLEQQLGQWTQAIEARWVAAKTRVSAVRNETRTPGYALLGWRASKEWKQVRVDAGIDNLFNRYYVQPLGGAYIGQRPYVWGQGVPGEGRSVYGAVTIKF